MKSLIKLFSLINSTPNLPIRIILTLTLTSLLSCGLGISDKNPSAAAPTTEPSELSQNSQRLPREIHRAVLRDASRRSGVAIAKLKITQVSAETFGNPCLFNFGEVCTREYKPIEGWEVTVKVKQESWTYHVNKSGSQIVLDPQINVSGNTQLPKAIANKILSNAAKRSGLAIASLKISQVDSQSFSNSCEFNFGEICTQVYKPISGWIVTVKVKRQYWTYHVDKSGSQIVLDPKISVTSKS